jgi:outer membrane scaffolding protein for murein synthesis (MipA/OmpV family)
LAFAALGSATGTVGAQSSQPTAAGQKDWHYSLGAAVIAVPRGIGSSKTRYLAVPTFEVKYKDLFFFDPINGAGFQAELAPGLTGSASLGISLDSRRAKDDARFQGLGNIPEAFAPKLSLGYETGDFFLSAGATFRLGSGNRRGATLDTDVGYNLLTTKSVLLSVGLTAKAMDSTYARNFLSVSAHQSLASGLPTFNARRGLQRAGGFVQSVYRISDDWTAFGRLEATQLQGDAGRSPLVVRKRQTTVLLTASRAF